MKRIRSESPQHPGRLGGHDEAGCKRRIRKARLNLIGDPTLGSPRAATASARRTGVIALGFAALICHSYLSLALFPDLLYARTDGQNYRHWVANDFVYSSSVIDLSVISPVQGMGGLIQPLAVWINPVYVVPQAVGRPGEPGVLSYFTVMLLIAVATFLLGCALRVPYYISVLAAQIVTVFSFDPIWIWSYRFTRLNGAHLYHLVGGTALPAALGTLALAGFVYLGTGPKLKNAICLSLLPIFMVYSIICDPLYMALALPVFCILVAGVVGWSESREILLWRLAGIGCCLAVAFALQLHKFYAALFGYAARAVFPNELFVEIQQWDYFTALAFQGGLATIAVVVLVGSCGVTTLYGTRQLRGLALSLIAVVSLMIVVSLLYVYGGIRWNYPAPVYLEVYAHPVYTLMALIGVWIGVRRLQQRSSPWLIRLLTTLRHRPELLYMSVVCIPFLGTSWVLVHAGSASIESRRVEAERLAPKPKGPIVQYLESQLAMAPGAQFRGSVATVVGVPGSPVGDRLGFLRDAPFSVDNISLVPKYLTATVDPNLYMTGLWNLGIPTLEDNNHQVTPPFHFLFSRALSRPGDYHSRNWAVINLVRPKLMAVMGARFLVTDVAQSDQSLTYVTEQKNGDGIVIRLYEIQSANLANVSPVRTVVSRNASETVKWLMSDDFAFDRDVVVHDESISDLVRAETGRMYFERGGVRVQARSRGRSLLLLPLQFSNSLQIVSSQVRGDSGPRLLRANLLETGVLFSGEIDIKIAHVFGPFRDIDGRLRDIEDSKRLGIGETGEIAYPPNYQPLALRKRPAQQR